MQRYSDQFDGIIAGDPGLRLPQAAIAEVSDTQAFASAAPRNPDGRRQLALSFSDDDLNLISASVVKQCRGADGIADGQNYRPDRCNFDPAVLQCRGVKDAQCLSEEQVRALHRVFDGARTRSGQSIYSAWPYDSGIGSANWRDWKLGDAHHPSRAETLGASAMQYVFATPPLHSFDIMTASVDDLHRSTAARSTVYTQSSTQFMDAGTVDLDAFEKRGGKAIIYHGGSDPVFSVLDTIAYYKQVQQAYGERTASFARLFIVPGMNHCTGGDYALDSFDSLDALVAWVEQGKAPDSITARAGQQSGAKLHPGMSRPLCPYPQSARYLGSGNPDDALSFVCKSS